MAPTQLSPMVRTPSNSAGMERVRQGSINGAGAGMGGSDGTGETGMETIEGVLI